MLEKKKNIEETLQESAQEYQETQEEIREVFDFINENDEKTKELQNRKYLQLLKTIEEDDAGFFRSSHIDSLGLPYETCIILTAKNSGKTWEQYRKFSECIEKGEKFIYMRAMRSELRISRTQFEVDDVCPCVMVESQGRFFIYEKKKYDYICEEEQEQGKLKPLPTRTLFKRYGVDFVGYGIDFMNCNSIGGESFEKFRYIIFDECLTHNPKNLITLEHCKIFDKFLSSVVRSKQSLRVYMYGNLTHKNNCLLEHYGINRGEKFKYMLRDRESRAHLLFCNLGGAYRASFKSQAGITKIGSIESIIENSTNKVLNSYPRIVDLCDSKELHDDTAWLFSVPRTTSELYVLQSYYFFTSENLQKVKNYFVSVKRVTPLLLDVLYKGKKLQTQEMKLSQFRECQYCPHLLRKFSLLFRLYKSNKIYFNSEDALNFFDDLYNKNIISKANAITINLKR